MSLLANVSVHEMHGIRRFLYPLSAEVTLWRPDFPLGLLSADGQPIPVQVTPLTADSRETYRLDFAVSLAPYEAIELMLFENEVSASVDDPLHVVEDGGFINTQKRFKIDFGGQSIYEVVYDGVAHLRERGNITLNGIEATVNTGRSENFQQATGMHLSAREQVIRHHSNGRRVTTQIEITACKSWAMMTHTLDAPKPGDEIVFTLPLAVTSPTLTCDFGAGGGIYGKLDAANAEIIWRTEFDAENGAAKWTVENSGRVDYVGEAASRQAHLPQRWFHVVDSDKALAAAITHVPDACETVTVTLKANGDVRVSFTMGEQTKGAATFGVCWHFLNDVPAVAAATNPQSILLPPTVEVLPA